MLYLIVFLLSLTTALAQQSFPGGGGLCSDAIPCKIGCCSKNNQCGFTPEHCGEGCKHDCDSKAECGQYAERGNKDCPLNVCCSKWGFCGITEDFCGDGCQRNSDGKGCGAAPRPAECLVETNALKYKRRVAYYMLPDYMERVRGCHMFMPEDLLVTGLTDINVAFINFGEDFKLVDAGGDIVHRLAKLRLDHPGLHVSIAIGGWTFNEGETADYWSKMASTFTNRHTFITSVVQYLIKYGLNGVDLDWEYPVAVDRAGHPDDFQNFVLLVAEMRRAFDREDPGWTITLTLPTSYWYLRGFDLQGLQKHVSWFNLMSYDLHGMWDYGNKWTGPYLRGHTDLDEIDLGLDLLWRNNIKPENVVLGFGFYGRSFTMADPNCHQPNGICQFTTGGNPGICSKTRGVLTYQEVWGRNDSSDAQTYYDPKTTVKYTVFDGNQWISYDDAQSFHDKKVFLSKRCLSGLMVWALNQDNGHFDAYHALMGDVSHLEFDGAENSEEEKERLAKELAAYTGQNCFVTTRCTDGSSREQGIDQVCPGGTQSVATAHAPFQLRYSMGGGEKCKKGWFKHICCPKDAAPKNCEWVGVPERNVLGCSGVCGRTQFKLATDTARDAKGEAMCYTGTRALCCDSTAILHDCYWTSCQDLRSGMPTCSKSYKFLHYRLNTPDGTGYCSRTFGSSDHERYGSGLCCPDTSAFSNCRWSNDPGRKSPAPAVPVSVDSACQPRPCKSNEIKVADALDPPRSSFLASGQSCAGVKYPPGVELSHHLCCDPPTRFNKNAPVAPEKLFPTHYGHHDEYDLQWHYNDDYRHNFRDDFDDPTEDGKDAFGFITLHGPEGSLDNSFSTTYTFVSEKREVPKTKRSLITLDQSVLDSVFDNATQVLHVYCNYPAGSPECDKIWIDGAEDTIIRLPNHVGEGPFARVVSMKPVSSGMKLPRHHVEHRSADGLHENPVYEVVIDYNFAAIAPKREDEPIFMRVDYSNMLTYWEEVVEAEPDRAKRGEGNVLKRHTTDEWHSRVQRAAQKHKALRKRSGAVNISVPMDPVMDEVGTENSSRNQKRWFGSFGKWLEKVTTVEKAELGHLPLGWADSINLFRAQYGCPGQTFSANLRMDLEAQLSMDVTYAYYFVGSFIPPSKPDVYAYLSISPKGYVGLRMEGNAVMQMTSGKKKLVDTLAYPGLAIKGIAAVGPTMDVFGEIRGKITLHGEARAGANLWFGYAQVYWPQNDEASQRYEKLLGLDRSLHAPDPEFITPTFEAGVRLDAQLDVIVQPQANIGIKIGGGSLLKTTIMDAQLSGYLTGDLSFQASSDVNTGTNSFRYSYGVYFFYNIGYTATAKILGLIDWALGPRKAWPQDQRINVYGPINGSIPLTKRSLDAGLEYAVNRSMLLPRAGDNGNGNQGALTPNQPVFSQNIQCPPGGSAPVRLPELRFGMCDGWKRMRNRPTTLTYSGAKHLVEERRKVQCKSGFCKGASEQFEKATGLGIKSPMSCDEAPWASTEEGGDFLDKADRTATCVPSYMNSGFGGNCQKLVSNLVSNWGKLDPTIPNDKKKDNWVEWKTPRPWTSQTRLGDNENRPVTYPNRMPPPEGMVGRTDEYVSWMFRRNYTWSIIDNSAQSSQWWGVTGREFNNKKYKPRPGHDAILCALNTFGQDDLFRMPKYNGYCLQAGTHVSYHWPAIPQIGRCLITFAPPTTTTTTKRSDGSEYYDGWEVLSYIRQLRTWLDESRG
ncbi:hypothetical protein VTJ04DRAFT_10307 [Mycothermus thermophilus]|uniref:uncharacterized protein n=1 Tax=Humicola insolens TaxID=85995 RepID=UPI0037427DFA